MTTQPDLLPDAPIDAQRLMEANLDDVPKEKWARGLVEAIEVQEAEFIRLGYAQDQAFRLARHGVLALSQYWGGRYRYLPRGDDLVTALRDAEIYRRHNGRNTQDLATEFKLTDRSVWRICRQQYHLHQRKLPLAFGQGEQE